MALANPVVVLPGITASSLRDEYPVSPESVWTAILKKSYQRIALHPDDTRYELVEPSRVVPEALFGIPYEELVLELRHNLRDHEDEPVPVFPFPYDWRQPLARTCAQLGAFVEEVIARTKLLRHYAKSPWMQDARVDLVGHSMGGLVIAGFLAGQEGPPRVGKVATLGTPFRGSFEAVLKVVTGTASLGPLEPSSREREAARLTPALYHLVPSFDGAVVDDAGAAVDLFEPKSWQGGVIATLAEHIRLHGVDPPRAAAERRARGRELLRGMLREAREFLDRVETLAPARAGLAPDAWLAIVGVDSETRVRLRVQRANGPGGGVRFHLTGADRRNTWENDAKSLDTGDGTVPLAGARPRFLTDEELVCVRPRDLGYWELADRVLLSPVGWHGLLPKCNLVQRLVVKHFRGAPGDDSVWASPMPGITPDMWRPPIRKLRAK